MKWVVCRPWPCGCASMLVSEIWFWWIITCLLSQLFDLSKFSFSSGIAAAGSSGSDAMKWLSKFDICCCWLRLAILKEGRTLKLNLKFSFCQIVLKSCFLLWLSKNYEMFIILLTIKVSFMFLWHVWCCLERAVLLFQNWEALQIMCFPPFVWNFSPRENL